MRLFVLAARAFAWLGEGDAPASAIPTPTMQTTRKAASAIRVVLMVIRTPLSALHFVFPGHPGNTWTTIVADHSSLGYGVRP